MTRNTEAHIKFAMRELENGASIPATAGALMNRLSSDADFQDLIQIANEAEQRLANGTPADAPVEQETETSGETSEDTSNDVGEPVSTDPVSAAPGERGETTSWSSESPPAADPDISTPDTETTSAASDSNNETNHSNEDTENSDVTSGETGDPDLAPGNDDVTVAIKDPDEQGESSWGM